jgi:hypothetical protein
MRRANLELKYFSSLVHYTNTDVEVLLWAIFHEFAPGIVEHVTCSGKSCEEKVVWQYQSHMPSPRRTQEAFCDDRCKDDDDDDDKHKNFAGIPSPGAYNGCGLVGF